MTSYSFSKAFFLQRACLIWKRFSIFKFKKESNITHAVMVWLHVKAYLCSCRVGCSDLLGSWGMGVNYACVHQSRACLHMVTLSLFQSVHLELTLTRSVRQLSWQPPTQGTLRYPIVTTITWQGNACHFRRHHEKKNIWMGSKPSHTILPPSVMRLNLELTALCNVASYA